MIRGAARGETDLRELASRRAESWPFALREFTRATGAGTPVDAAEVASVRLLKTYFSRYQGRQAVSVSNLCDLLGIDLRTKLSKRLSPETTGLSSRSGPTTASAKLSFLDKKPVIEVMDAVAPRARVSAAHELGHYLIHLRDGGLDYNTLRAGSTPEEEALSEYIGRLLLMPLSNFRAHFDRLDNTSVACLNAAKAAIVSMHASASRLNDPDQPQNKIRGIIFWRMRKGEQKSSLADEILTPYWHVSDEAFIPIGKCRARRGSLIATLANSEGDVFGSTDEDVNIGSLAGHFRVDGFAWGSLHKGTRCVLSVFVDLR